MVPGPLGERRILVAVSLAAYIALVFVGLARIEVPGLGLAHLLYLPVALLALATGPVCGASAGGVAAALYAFGASINPNFQPDDHLLSLAGVIRLTTFSGIGWLIGSAAAHNRELMKRLKEHAERDYLTDLVNTRAFESALTDRLGLGQPFALVLADADDLKLVNDREGHAAGNDHLRRLASVLREATAPEDTVARIGGDEFAVLTSAGSRSEAETAGRRLRDALSARGISATFGYATFPGEGVDRLALFHTADKRLYEGKLAGIAPGKQPVSPVSPLPNVLGRRPPRRLYAAPAQVGRGGEAERSEARDHVL
jgi:diguanylate cyclase (GGDEF)-like protein